MKIIFTKKGTINNLQFAVENSPLISIQSPGIIDVSSDSGEEFVVQPNDLPELEERFRAGGPRSDLMMAFIGAASATLFASETEDPGAREMIDTAGTSIDC